MLDAGRRNRPDTGRTGAAANPVEQVFRGPEFGLDCGAANQGVVHRQRPDHGRIAGIAALRLHQLFRVGVPVVQVEHQRHVAAMRRQRDDQSLERRTAAEDIAELALRGNAHAQRRLAFHFRDFGRRRHRRRRFAGWRRGFAGLRGRFAGLRRRLFGRRLRLEHHRCPRQHRGAGGNAHTRPQFTLLGSHFSVRVQVRFEVRSSMFHVRC